MKQYLLLVLVSLTILVVCNFNIATTQTESNDTYVNVDEDLLEKVNIFYNKSKSAQEWIMKFYAKRITESYKIAYYYYKWVEAHEKHLPEVFLKARNPSLFNILQTNAQKERDDKYTNYVFWDSILLQLFKFGTKKEMLWGFRLCEKRGMLYYLGGTCEVTIGPIIDSDDILILDDSIDLLLARLYKSIVESIGTKQFGIYAMMIIKSSIYLMNFTESDETFDRCTKFINKYVEVNDLIHFPKSLDLRDKENLGDTIAKFCACY